MGEPDDGRLSALYLTTRDVGHPRTGADNRAKSLYEGLDDAAVADLVHFDRTGRPDACGDGVSVPYPASELLAMVSVRFLLAVRRAVRGGGYDVVVASGIGAVTYGLVASWLAGATFVFDDHNVESEIARGTSFPRYVVVSALERLACAVAGLVVVPTASTARTLAARADADVEVIANGFDDATFTAGGPEASFEGPTLLFFGNFDYAPNREAAAYLVDELAPRVGAVDPDARVRLAGPGHDALDDGLPRNVELIGFVDDLPSAIRGADVVVVPLRTGSGSRLKIIESLACGTPVVSTPKGAEGWPAEWTNLRLVELEGFAAAAIESLDGPAFDRSELGAYEEYAWHTQSTRLVDAVRELVEAEE